jgi:hypothetical protein
MLQRSCLGYDICHIHKMTVFMMQFKKTQYIIRINTDNWEVNIWEGK